MRRLREPVRLGVLMCLGWLVASCIDLDVGPPPTATHTVREKISGGNVHDVTNEAGLPYRAVGRVAFTAGGSCTATAFGRDRVLLAAHCLCNGTAGTFFLPQPGGSVVQVALASVTPYPANFASIFCVGSTPSGSSARDLAVALLSRNLTTTELPTPLKVYTAGDFIDRVMNPPTSSSFFGAPNEIIGFSSTPNRWAATISAQTFTQDCGLLGLGPCSWRFIDIPQGPRFDPGDSGGPTTFWRNGTDATTYGVHSAVRSSSGRDSPTFDDRGNGNGVFIRQFISDADEDGVNDATDNCTPAKAPQCLTKPWLCVNPDQADDDGDGVGDACDNCRATACAAINFSTATCANANQYDADNDGIGDVCDRCPATAGAGADTDGDGVGDVCDNCWQKANGFARCSTAADCGGATCLSLGTMGRCSAGANFGAACQNTAHCAGGICLMSSPLTGRCSTQRGDTDGDGIGDACDSCPTIANAGIEANSNDLAETKNSATAMADICDPVPVYVSKPIVGGFVPNLPAYASTSQVTTFLSTASLGQGGSVSSVGAQAGFRHCSCTDVSGNVLSRSDCLLQDRCSIDRGLFPSTSPSNRWKRVTTATNGNISMPPTPATGAGIDQRLTRTFTTTVSSFRLPHPEQTETSRIGGAEVLGWFSARDVSEARVESTLVNGVAGTTGLFWSHVPDGTTASARDTATALKLRDNYEYLSTPLVRPLRPTYSVRLLPCVFLHCQLMIRPDWLWDPAPVRNYTDPPPFSVTSWPARAFPTDTGQQVAVGGSAQPQVEITAAMPFSVLTLLNRTDMRWLSPSEPGSRTNRAATDSIYVGAPATWTAATLRPTALRFITSTLRKSPVATPPAGTPGFVPSDRTGYGAFFAASERRFVMIGGHDPSTGRVTSEVWSYGLETDVWTHLFAGVNHVPVADVLAVAYDAPTKQFVTLDRWLNSVDGLTYDRLALFNVSTGTSTTLMNAADTGRYARFGMAVDNDGSLLLTGQPATGSTWDVYRFRVNTGSLVWVNAAHPTGQLLDAPVRMATDVYVPVLVDTAQELVASKSLSFVTDTNGIRF